MRKRKVILERKKKERLTFSGSGGERKMKKITSTSFCQKGKKKNAFSFAALEKRTVPFSTTRPKKKKRKGRGGGERAYSIKLKRKKE